MAVNAVCFWASSCMTVKRAIFSTEIVNDEFYVYFRLLDVYSSTCLLICLVYKFISSTNTENLILCINTRAFYPPLSNNSFKLLTSKLNIPLMHATMLANLSDQRPCLVAVGIVQAPKQGNDLSSNLFYLYSFHFHSFL